MYLRRVYGMPQMIVCFLVFLVFDLFFFSNISSIYLLPLLCHNVVFTRAGAKGSVCGV